jgi:hypothetical protein
MVGLVCRVPQTRVPQTRVPQTRVPQTRVPQTRFLIRIPQTLVFQAHAITASAKML